MYRFKKKTVFKKHAVFQRILKMRFLYNFKTHKKNFVALQLKNRYITLILSLKNGEKMTSKT